MVSKLKSLPVLRMVAVKVDAGFVRCAQQCGWDIAATKLPDHRAGVVRSVLDFQVVVISFSRKIQKLNMCTYEKIWQRNES